MKSIALLGFALAMSPVLASAQQSPAPEAGARFPHPDMAAMQQVHAQMEQIHKQARAQILGALTPAHRSLLAGVIGQLAVAPTPDRAAAVRTLDNALSQGEARSVVAAETNARTQSRALMESARSKFEASLSADERAQMQQRMAAHEAERANETRPQPTTDPGEILLGVSMGGERHGFGPGGPPPPGR